MYICTYIDRYTTVEAHTQSIVPPNSMYDGRGTHTILYHCTYYWDILLGGTIDCVCASTIVYLSIYMHMYIYTHTRVPLPLYILLPERHTHTRRLLGGYGAHWTYYWVATIVCVPMYNGRPNSISTNGRGTHIHIDYWVATISRLLKIIGLFCRIFSLL